jgi:hypothetical protein
MAVLIAESFVVAIQPAIDVHHNALHAFTSIIGLNARVLGGRRIVATQLIGTVDVVEVISTIEATSLIGSIDTTSVIGVTEPLEVIGTVEPQVSFSEVG